MLTRLLNTITTEGLRSSIRSAIAEFRICLSHRQGVRRARAFRHSTDLRLHLGCGKNLKPGFINIDMAKGADLRLDLRERFPFSTNSCSMIYAEHVLEHFDYPRQALVFLAECHRVLKPGGVFSAGVPDTEWPMRAYAEGDGADYFRHAKQWWHPRWCITRMEHINHHFRQGGEHRFAYDWETLKCVVGLIGFQDVRRRDFNPELDSEGRKVGTIFVEASKGNRS